MQAQVVCTSVRNTKAWHTGQATFGHMKEGAVFDITIELCQKLLKPEGAAFLKQIGERFSFEIVVGYNGRLWLNAADPREPVFIFNLLQMWETDSDQALSTLNSIS
jgi:exosome complex RNA-binding protein Rrp4